MTGLYVASNPTALSAQFGLVRNMGALGDTLTRLSTGLKLNSGKDDPAGLIASELLKAQITGTNKAITNAQRANSLIATADSSMNMIGNLLNDVKGLVVEAANTGTMTTAQIAANQMQVDAALDSIDRIARTTNYGGKKILDGSLGFQTAGMGGGLSNVQINSANFGTADAVGVNVNVQSAADYARLVSNGTGVSVDTVLDVVGNNGSATVTLGAGATNDEIAAAINRSTDSTGVLAYVEGKEQAGSLILSSAGSGNDILITANAMGLDAGNYDWRITRGDTNDVRIVSDPGAGKPGVIEISLTSAYESRTNNFAGLFDISIDTTNRDNPQGAATSISMQQGANNNVVYNTADKAAATNVINGKSLVAQARDSEGNNINSQLNGWTIAVDDRIATEATHSVADGNTKTIYVNSTSFDSKATLNSAIKNAMMNTVDGTVADFDSKATFDVSIIGRAETFQNGDRFTFAGGATEGELTITYAAGATANDILGMLNAAPNVSASLASGVNGNAVIPNMPNGLTRVASTENVESRFSSGATSAEVIDLINSKLGHMFTATGMDSDKGTGGRVSYMDASAVHGDINLGNALRFNGMDNGPIVRLTNLGTNGQPVANQQLGVNIIHPSEADIKAGIHTPILEIKLATDAVGNSITRASDITKLFNSLTAEQTMGVSVSQLFPPGVDPNNCVLDYDGIVQPTSAPGICDPFEGDLVLLGGNQSVVADNAVAKIAGHNRPTVGTTATTSLTTNAHIPVPPTQTFVNNDTGATSISLSNALSERLDGLTIAFSTGDSHSANAFNSTTGTLTLAVGATSPPTAENIANALNHALSGIGDNGDFLNDINVFLGRSVESSQAKAVVATDITANTIVSSATPSAVNSFKVVNNNPSEGYGPQLTFDRDLAIALEGVEIRFASVATTASTWDNANKVLTLGLGATATQATVNGWTDAQFLTAVNNALADGTLDTAIRAGLGLETVANGGPRLEVSGAAKNNLQVATTVALAETNSSRTTMGAVPTNEAITGAAIGAVTPAGDATGGSFEFTFNGTTFSVSADSVTANFEMSFGTPGSAGVLWTAGDVQVTLGTTFLDAGFATAEAFATALQGVFNTTPDYTNNQAADGPGGSGGATGTGGEAPPAFTVSIVSKTTSDWNPIHGSGSPELTVANLNTALGGPRNFAASSPQDASGKTILSFGETSAMNGMSFTFTREEAREGFNDTTGTLTVFLGSEFEALQAAVQRGDAGAVEAADNALRAAVNGAIAANWEGIRAFTGEGNTKTNTAVFELEGPVKLSDKQDDAFTVANAIADAAAADNPYALAADGKTTITGSYVEGTVVGQRGIGQDDAVMSITAKEEGTHMAGISIHFVNDTNSGLNQWNNAYDANYAAGDALPDIKVELHTKTDGSRELIITGNLGAASGSELNAGLLARALNAAVIQDVAENKQYAFSSMFDANALQFAPGNNNGDGMSGSVLFNRDVSAPAGMTAGGYRVDSGTGTSTSSGIGMFGQSDANERLVIESEVLGSEQFVQVNVVSGALNIQNEAGFTSSYASGHDMMATINGIRATTQGNHVSINTGDLSVSMDVANGVGNTGFTITGGGALFQLGPDVISQQQIRVGIGSMMTTNLGGRDGQLYMLRSGGIAALDSSDGGRKLADKIVNQAIENVAVQRARLGATQRGTLEPTIASLQDSLVAMTEANALITNADFAVESSNLTRLQLLIQTGMQTLGIANQMPQYAAQLVR